MEARGEVVLVVSFLIAAKMVHVVFLGEEIIAEIIIATGIV